MKVSVIIPTMNEETGIVKVIKRIPKEYEIIVIDKSTDRTAELAKKAGAKIIIQKTKGKGNAMVEAVKKATGDLIVFIDGDGTYPTEKIREFVDRLNVGKYDVISGKRILKINKNIKGLNWFGNKIFCFIASVLYERIDDFLTGLFVITKEHFSELNLKSEGFAIETEFFIKCHKKGFKRLEVPIVYKRRLGTTNLHPFRDGYMILKELLKGVFY